MRENQRSTQAAQNCAQGGADGEQVLPQAGCALDPCEAIGAPETIVVADVIHTAKERQEISRLRHERWALLAHLGRVADGDTMRLTDPQKARLNQRLNAISARLYSLTSNPIYHVD